MKRGLEGIVMGLGSIDGRYQQKQKQCLNSCHNNAADNVAFKPKAHSHVLSPQADHICRVKFSPLVAIKRDSVISPICISIYFAATTFNLLTAGFGM